MMDGESKGRFYRDDFLRFAKNCGITNTNNQANELVRLGYFVSIMIDKKEFEKATKRYNAQMVNFLNEFRKGLFEDCGLVIDIKNQGNNALFTKLYDQHEDFNKESMFDILINFRQISSIIDLVDESRQQDE